MNLRRFFTFFLSTLLFAGAVSAEFSPAFIPIPGLPADGGCTANALGIHDATFPPGPEEPGILISDLNLSEQNDKIRLNFKAVAAEMGSSNFGQLSGSNLKRIFPVAYRCDQYSSSPSWELVPLKDTGGNLNTGSFHYTAIVTAADMPQRELFDEGATSETVYWYVLFNILWYSDSEFMATLANDESAYTQALAGFTAELENIDSSKKINWSSPLVGRISTLPKQDLAIKYPTSVGSLTAVTATTISIPGVETYSVSPLFTSTIDAEYASNPSYTWDGGLSLDGQAAVIPTLTSIFPGGANGNMISMTGTFDTTNSQPGTYSVTVSVAVTNASGPVTGTTSSVTNTYTWLVRPPVARITSSAGPHTLEIGNSESFTLGSDYGYSKYATSKATAEFVIVNNLETAVGVASLNGNVLTVNLEDTAGNAAQSYPIKLRVQDACIQGQVCDSNLLTVGEEFTFTVYAKPHEFDFASDIRTKSNAFAAAPSSAANWEKFRHNVSASSRISFEIGVNANHSNGYNIYLDGISGSIGATPITTLSQLGMEFVTAASTAAMLRETSINSSIATTGATFTLNIRAVGGTGTTPATTSVALGFVILDGKAPSVVSAVWDAFNWGGYVDTARAAVIPVKNQARTLTVNFDEPMCTAPQLSLRLGTETYGPVAGTLTAPSTTITYSYNFNSWTADTEQTFYYSTDTAGKDCQDSGLLAFFTDAANSSTASTEFTSKVVKPLALVTPSLVDVSPFNAFELTFTKPLAASMTDSVLTTAFLAPGMGNFYATKVSNSVVRINPVTSFAYGSFGLTLVATRILDSEYYPMVDASANVADQVLPNTQLKIGPDTYSPKIVSRSVTANARTTAVTFVFDYDEPVVFVECSPAAFCANQSGSSANKIVISTSDLAYNTEYNVTLVVRDVVSSGNPNRTTEQIKWVTMIAEEADAIAQPVADTEAPYLVKITPDLRDADFAANVPLSPEINFLFNEAIQSGTISMNLVLAGNSTAVIPVQTFENGFIVRPLSALTPESAYKLEISGIKDLSNNTMLPVTYNFVTVPSVVQKAAPLFSGAAFSYVNYGAATTGLAPVAPNATLAFYFDQTVDTQSAAAAFTLTSASDLTLSGSFVADGRMLVFTPSRSLLPGVTYTFSFAPGLSGLFGNVTTAKLEGQFLTRADNAIRDFNIIARNSAGSSHAVTASWRNPVTPVNFFRLTAKLSETFSFDSAEAAQTLTVAYSANVAKMTTGFVLSDAGGKNLLVEIEGCNGTPASATCVSTATAETYGLLASAPAASAATETFISKASSTVVSVALEVKENKTVPPVTVKVAPSALPFSTAVAVSEIPATQKTALLAKPGVTSRVAAPMQFGPDGLVFEEPVDVAISFDPQEVIAGTPSASALLEKMQGLVYLPEQGRWMAKGIAKSRVELVGNNEALLWLRVPHFSVISASVALAFASANSSLVELRADDTTSVTLSWDKTVQTSSVRYALSNPNQAVRQTNFTTNADSVVIYVSGQSMGLATYTVEVCDDAVNDCASTPGAWISTSLTFNVVSEDADNTSLPLRDVTTFAVYLTSNGTAANLSWEIPAADKVVGSKTIQDVEIAYRPLDQAAGTEIVLSINRAVETTAITGLTAGKAYVWRLRTRNASQVYSTDAEYRFTAGTVESAVTDGNVSSLSGGVRVVANSAALLTNLASVGILDSTTTFKVGGTTLEIKGNGLVDLNFSSTTSASAKITLNTTGSNLVVYHYRLSPTNGVGAWRELPTQNDASAAKYVYYTKNALETEFTVYSRGGEGSPFAVAPKIVSPVVYRSGGGGGCSVAGNCCDEEHAGSWINFLLMLMPLGYLLLRKFK